MPSLRQMNEAEFETHILGGRESYALEKMRANGLSKEDALRVADESFQRYLPDGFSTPKNYFYIFEGDDQEDLGYIWWTEQKSKAFLADIVIFPNHRGKGYGKVAMELLSQDAKAKGKASILLHVFGHNKVAVGLYDSLGYEVTDLMMEKSI